MQWTFSIFWFVIVILDLVTPFVPGNNATSYPCTDHNNIFLVPGVMSAGGSSRACVSRFHHAGPVRMVVTLYTERHPAVTAVRELGEGDGGCIDISVPQLPNTKAEVVVNLRYPEAQCAWERRVETRIAGGRVVVAHTERARLRPGELMRARVFVLKPDLTPAHGAIDEIWLEGPNGSWEGARAAEWKRVRTRLGVAQIQHLLDDLAPAGRWTVRVRLADGSQGTAAFQVADYELPPFQLSVRHAHKVLNTSERLVWTVCVRYPWTEAVEGMLVIRIRGAGGPTGNSSAGNAGIRTAVRLRAPKACHRHAAAAKRIGFDDASAPDVVVADFSFQEESTRIWQNTTVVSQVVDKPVTLEFLTKHRFVISPWLPYKLKIRATRWDDRPASNERIKVCKSSVEFPDLTLEMPIPNGGFCDEAVTDASGIAKIMFVAGDDGMPFYRFHATIKNDSKISSSPLYLPVQRQGSVHAALGPLKADAHDVRTLVPLYLSMKNVTSSLTVHFVVITRGGIIYRWGATTQCPTTNSADEVQTASRNSRCYIDEYPNYYRSENNSSDPGSDGFFSDQNALEALLDKQILRVMLPVKVSRQMCPDSHLIAYFYYKGELISASKYLEMEECLVNKVEATFPSRQTMPGSRTDLHLKTSGPAICALTALDSASKWVQPGPSFKKLLLSGLKSLMEGHRNLTEYDAAGECFTTIDTPTLSSSIELTASWLAGAGVRMVGGDQKSQICGTAPALLVAEDITVPRSDFSEAWLWDLVPIGLNGTATVTAKAPDSITRYEATAVCVARTGVAISQPAVLQVFREFFIHADSPRRLRRGDTTIIRYRLFNYVYEPLSVQIQILTDPHLEGPSDYVESACIGARTSIARRVEVRARLPGNARVSIRAKSVIDGGCGNATLGRIGVSDEVIIQMTVDPEGIPVQDQKSVLLCGRGSKESSTSTVSWSWPTVKAVPGTESLTAWAVGDIAGPLFADADDLVLLPRGCGEQNLARMATNLLALKQLDPASIAAAIAKEHVSRGFTRQLQYVHPAGGFSAFGASDATPSTWLTAFAVRYLGKAHRVLNPTLPLPAALEQAENWLLSQQMENGCFRNEGQVFHRELRGGLDEDGEIASVTLTAYVITSLIDNSVLPSRIIRNALSCLRALPPKTKSPSKIYARSLLAYAFIKLRRYEDAVQNANEASLWDKEVGGLGIDEEVRELVELLRIAKRGGEFVWWETGSLASSIEATGYALLALCGGPAELKDSSFADDARAAVRWLSTQRNSAGGFVATQDTLIALEALTSWSSTQRSTRATRLAVTARSGDVSTNVTLTAEAKVPDVMSMGMGEHLQVGVEGIGCALIQATRSYNTYSVEQHEDPVGKQLSIQVAVHTDGAFNCEANGTNCYCAAVVETCVLWTGSFPEMALLELTLPGGYGADATLLYSQLHKETLLRRIELSPARITYYLGSRGAEGGGHSGRGGGHQCWQAHAVGPRTRTQPAHAHVKSYYAPEVNDSQMYTIPEDCPPRISHEPDPYLTSDNLFAKARSDDNGEDIIITQDFAFEDFPEGIPLEDPVYDNLTKEEDKNRGVKEKINENDLVGEGHRKDNQNGTTIKEASTVKSEPEHLNGENVVQNMFLVSSTDNEKYISNHTSDTLIKDTTNKTDTSDVKGVIEDSSVESQEKQVDSTSDEELMTSHGDFKRLQIKSVALNKNGGMRINTATVRKGKFFTDLETDREGLEPEVLEVELNSGSVMQGNQTSIAQSDTDNQVQIESTETTKYGETNHGQDSKQTVTTTSQNNNKQNDLTVDNPNLSSFHVIDTPADLVVPSGIEGPIPALALPPPNVPRAYKIDSYLDQPFINHPLSQSQPKQFRSPGEGNQQFHQSDQTLLHPEDVQNDPPYKTKDFADPWGLPYESQVLMSGGGPNRISQPRRSYFYNPIVPDAYYPGISRDIRFRKVPQQNGYR